MGWPNDNFPVPTVSVVDPLTCEERAIIMCALREYKTMYKGFLTQNAHTSETIATTEAALEKIQQFHGGW